MTLADVIARLQMELARMSETERAKPILVRNSKGDKKPMTEIAVLPDNLLETYTASRS